MWLFSVMAPFMELWSAMVDVLLWNEWSTTIRYIFFCKFFLFILFIYTLHFSFFGVFVLLSLWYHTSFGPLTDMQYILSLLCTESRTTCHDEQMASMMSNLRLMLFLKVALIMDAFSCKERKVTSIGWISLKRCILWALDCAFPSFLFIWNSPPKKKKSIPNGWDFQLSYVFI